MVRLVFVGIVLALAGIAGITEVGGAPCVTKCGEAFFFKKQPIDKLFAVVVDEGKQEDIVSCRRIWRTMSPENDIANDVSTTRRTRELLGPWSCGDTCQYNGGVWGVAKDCQYTAFGAVGDTVDCFSECIEDPTM